MASNISHSGEWSMLPGLVALSSQDGWSGE